MGCTQSSTTTTKTAGKSSCECCSSAGCDAKKQKAGGPPVTSTTTSKSATNAPPNVPRTAWMIFAANDKKIGKLVMQLKGKGVSDVTEDFEMIYKQGTVKKENWSVNPVENAGKSPVFYISTAKSTTKEFDNKKDVYGVILEGHDVFQEMKGQSENAITVKQAHLFPVKVAK